MKLLNYGKKLFILLFLLNLLIGIIYCFEDKLTTHSENKNLALSNAKNKNKNSNNKYSLNGGIYVSEKFFKKKKDIPIAVSPTASNSKNSINDVFKSNSELARGSNLGDILGMNRNNPISSDANIGDGPIYIEMWAKYFKYTDDDLNIQTPKHFFQNNEFFNQMKMFPNADLKETDHDGQSTYIRDKTYFYILLFSRSLNFVTSRQIQFQKTYDSLNLNLIEIVAEEDENWNGGIKDFGNFNEGYCIKVTANKPRMTSWVLCTETLENKKRFMSILKNLKLKIQREEGVLAFEQNKKTKETLTNILNPNSPDDGSSQKLKKDKDGNLGVTFGTNQKITDGYWIVLQDWTQCSLKCGSGISTLHRMCVPPKNGGAPCQQPGILTKPCNTQPCPDIIGTGEKKDKNTINMKPIVKVMPFSSRPQRYTKCVIKESDLMMVNKKGNNINNNPLLDRMNDGPDDLQIPTRVIMNKS